ncbi:MAG: cytochrome c3 family protein, partial [Candidatus Eisenbacteria bacterium]
MKLRVTVAAVALIIGAGIAVGVALLSCRSEAPREPSRAGDPAPAFVGTATCKECHAGAYEAWRGSDHDLAMMVATAESVLGDFADATFTHQGVTSRFYRREGRYFVATEGTDGRPGEFEIAYTFGVRPLQQYLVPFPGGRLQALPVAWDTARRRWFHLYPDQKIPPADWLHWTRNGQNWNGMCAECHSTNLRKNYDPESATYATTWSDLNVGCEACHGPASSHLAWAKKPPEERQAADRGLVVATRGISARRTVELCAACHSRRAELGDYDHAAANLLDQMLPSLLDEGLYEADGQQKDEVYTYGSFVQSRMYARGLHCGDCHDPHAAKLRAPGNTGCVRCHNPAGAALREGIDGAGLLRKEYDSPSHHFHRAGERGSACVDCHAPPRTYMIVDPRHDHSFRIPRPDLTATTGSPNACNGCHANRSTAWASASVERWYGPNRR